jgi:hypothetical protein
MTLPVEGVVSADEVMSADWLLADEVVSDEGGDAGCCLLKRPQRQLWLQ